MIVVDTSALVSIFAEEHGFELCLNRLLSDEPSFLPVSAYVEFLLVSKLRESRKGWIDELLRNRIMALTPVEPEHGPIAAEAARRYGKGSGHPAQLNFGDCLAYSVAKQRDLPLLYIGNDFSQTDLRSALL